MVVTIFIVSLITFFAFQIIPGDPVLSKLGVDADQAQIDALTNELNLDQPVIRRYFSWLTGIFKGDLGNSIRYDRDVGEMILSRLPVTFSLSIISMLLVIIFGIPIGILSAKYDKKASGFFINFLTQVSMAIPSFWTGILLMYLFGLILNWITPGAYTPWSENAFEAFKSLILPSLAIAIPNIAVIVRYLRNTILEQKNQDYTRTALSKGAKPGYVLTRHILRNALIPVVTVFGMIAAKILAGSIIIEQVFSLPGLGRLLINAISTRDLPLVQGMILYFSVLIVIINFLIDIIYKLIDPRIKYT
ncbi:peptide/nickel transport system permease protein [Geotoga petraea]|jgi:peptide/nickel transport system permease protein|nr:peptide/nickel transport system permease protein [Geotoga sp.]SDC34259.1 peptide/nickel transport system permease protein [Geotoga petraea]